MFVPLLNHNTRLTSQTRHSHAELVFKFRVCAQPPPPPIDRSMTPSLTRPLPDGDSGDARMETDYSSQPITPAGLSSSSPARREADAGRERDRQRGERDRQRGERERQRGERDRDRSKWPATTMMEGRGEEITKSSSPPPFVLT